MLNFEEFEDLYKGLLPELKTEGQQVFKVVINLNQDEEEEQAMGGLQFNEEFGYQQQIKTVISKIDSNSIHIYSDNQIVNPFEDVFGFFTNNLKEALTMNHPQLNQVLSNQFSSLD